jgi:putative FmdB family regulatory protein
MREERAVDRGILSQRINLNPGRIMPVYEYACRKCGEKFSEVMTMKEHETRKVLCPKCQSNDLEKIIEPFFAKTARKS